MGVVEVVIDNRGKIVPHTATLVRLAGGRRQIVDFWYGSKDIKHKRLGLNVKRGHQWQVEDLDFQELKAVEDISFLPNRYVDAITLYIEGNRALKKGDYAQAVEQYSHSIRLYPENARTYYNRAIAYEKLGERKKAEGDYARALQDDSAIMRTRATQPEEIVDLIRLDEKNISEREQQVYLLSQGFVTGQKVSPPAIALKSGLPPEEIMNILASVEKTLSP